MAMGSSLHPLAASEELDLGAFLYAVRRLPDRIAGAELVVMGQEIEQLTANGVPADSWQEAEAPARRRRWYDSGAGTLAVLLASASDVDDLVPTLVAYQIEVDKIRVRMRAGGWPDAARSPDVPPEECARELGGSAEDWARLRAAWGERFGERDTADRRAADCRCGCACSGGTHTGYARLTRRWWTPVSAELAESVPPTLTERPMYFVSSNSHSLVNIVTGIAREREDEMVAFVEELPEGDILRQELTAFREGRSEGSWKNFLYFVARLYFDAGVPEAANERRAAEREKGITHLRSKTALRVPAQVMPLAALDPNALDPRVGEVDFQALAATGAVIVNIDYPLGVAAYNILREIAVDRSACEVSTSSARPHAECRRRRCDDFERGPRRALGLHLLAR